ncbi:hypothetical protein [Flagellimonas sp.]|uniref:hypothetical protein n=1 Tax=Flagellimonas sp. TaxID=2058762 RepID=UPI003F4A624E
MGKKNLEQLFKDIFKDFHEIPDDKVWKSIEASLDKKENKKRVIPIWWQLGGVAALFAILFFTINPFGSSGDSESSIPNVVDTEKTEQTVPATDAVEEPTELVGTSEEASDINGQKNGIVEPSLNEYQKSEVVDADTTPKTPKPSQDKQVFKSNDINSVARLDEDNVRTNENLSEDSRILTSEKEKSEVTDAVALVESDEKKGQEPNVLENKTSEQDFGNQKTEVAQVDVSKEDKEPEEGKKSIYDAIAEKNAETDEELLAENNESKWSVGPSVAPVYFQGAGEGSPIHSNFSSNSKSGNVNLSYGLTVSYNLGKRLKVRSGVHRVDFGYDTNEIVFSSSLQGSTNELIDNITYAETSRNLVVQSSKSLPSEASAQAFTEFQSNDSPALDGKMVQQLGYIEVPLELNYALIDKKFGVDIIGGVSSLFLVDNTILLESEELVTEVGEANNANSVNFSTNVGVGLNYEVSPKVQLNLEPVFKYQLNTFSETAGPFRPFSVGVYSGVSFRF